MSPCTATLARGESCTPECFTAAAYALSGSRSCFAGQLEDTAICTCQLPNADNDRRLAPCLENHHVVDNTCVLCSTGSRLAGDDPSRFDTFCSCAENEHVVAGNSANRIRVNGGLWKGTRPFGYPEKAVRVTEGKIVEANRDGSVSALLWLSRFEPVVWLQKDEFVTGCQYGGVTTGQYYDLRSDGCITITNDGPYKGFQAYLVTDSIQQYEDENYDGLYYASLRGERNAVVTIRKGDFALYGTCVPCGSGSIRTAGDDPGPSTETFCSCI
mgnify:CR=1 FL=1